MKPHYYDNRPTEEMLEYYEARIACLIARVHELEAENERLRLAFPDAVCTGFVHS